ncbi:hypothetical protein HK096_008877, partial [Nowakowskiella sp. JEL0078]
MSLLKGTVLMFEIATEIQDWLVSNNMEVEKAVVTADDAAPTHSFYELMVARNEAIEEEEYQKTTQLQLEFEEQRQNEQQETAQRLLKELDRKNLQVTIQRQKWKEEKKKSFQTSASFLETLDTEYTENGIEDELPNEVTSEPYVTSTAEVYKISTAQKISAIDASKYLAFCPTVGLCVLQSISFDVRKSKSISELISSLFDIQHPHLISIFDYKIQNNTLTLLTQHHQMDILSLLKTTTSVSKDWIKAVMNGLHALHDEGESHSGICLRNLVIADGRVKIAGLLESRLDFSLGIENRGWRPPELEDSVEAFDLMKYDIWVCTSSCLGRTISQLTFGSHITTSFSDFEEFVQSQPSIDQQLLIFLRSTLHPNPNMRPSLTRLLMFPYFTSASETTINHQIPSQPTQTPTVVSRYRLDFLEVEFLGKGGFGSVVKARNRVDGRYYAVKKIVVRNRGFGIDKILREVQTVSRLHHQFVVRYYQAWFENLNEESQFDVQLKNSETSLTDESDESEIKSNSKSESEDENDDSESDWLESRDNSHATFETGKGKRVLYIQMEYCEKKTLRQRWRLFRQILEGLAHIHLQGMIHRDLKPPNIFLDALGNVKIGDFGLAVGLLDDKRMGSSGSTTNLARKLTGIGENNSYMDASFTGDIGTPVYVSPEIENRAGKYSSKVDMYSLGIVFFEMCYSLSTGMQRALVLRDLRLSPPVFPEDFPSNLSNERTIITQLLSHSPKSRPSCNDLLNSKLLPPKMEEEYISEALRTIVNRSNSTYYSRLVDAVFAQEIEISEQWNFDYGFEESDKFVGLSSIEVVRSAVMKVAGRHGALEVSPPMMVPRSDVYQFTDKKPVEYLNSNGRLVQLPFDLTLPFARYVARNASQINMLKRYSFDRVYRINENDGQQPKNIFLCDFDIVANTPTKMVADAEVIKMVTEVLDMLPHQQPTEYQVRLGHQTLLELIFDRIGISSDKSTRRLGYFILEKLDRPTQWPQILMQLTQALKLSKSQVELFDQFRNLGIQLNSEKILSPSLNGAVPSNSQTSDRELVRRLMLILGGRDREPRGILTKVEKIVKEFEDLKKYLIALNVKLEVTVIPLLSYNSWWCRGEILFQIATWRKKKLDVVAAGGRYDSLLRDLRYPLATQNLYAVGAQIAIQRLIHNISQTSLVHSLSKSNEFSNVSSQDIRRFKKGDVFIVSFSNEKEAIQERMSIAAECWCQGISAEFGYEEVDSSMLAQNLIGRGFVICIVVKMRGLVLLSTKVRNLITKNEVEVSRNVLMEQIMEELQEVDVMPSGFSFDNDGEGSLESTRENRPHQSSISNLLSSSVSLGTITPIYPPGAKQKPTKHKQKGILRNATRNLHSAVENIVKAPTLAVEVEAQFLRKLLI